MMSAMVWMIVGCFALLARTQGFLFTKEVCYNEDGIGCFSNASPFNNANSKLPESPAHIQIQYLLYTRQNRNTAHLITPTAASIRQSHFSGAKKTKFIIHGFSDSGHQRWLLDMAHAILDTEDANVILVNWEKGADNINYFQAAANTRVVGALIAKLMEALHTSGHANYRDMHLIGHSLGSHIAGYAAEKHHMTGRITGLDPAGPCFENKDPAVRLDPTDALFVDAIHTDGDSLLELGFGLKRPVGDADYYPNGGVKQPGCTHEVGKHLFSLITLQIESFTDGIACSHMRVLDLFTESIRSPCHFTSYPCNSEEDFNAGRCNSCGSGCVRMGYHADQGSRSGTFYLHTRGQSSFCMA